MKQILLMLTLLTVGFSYAQDVILDGTAGKQNVTACAGNFFDTGGDGGPLDITGFYQDNENDTITICPDVAGKLLRFIVTDYRIQQNDQLCIYDGNSTTANLLGCYTADGQGYQLQPGDTIQSTTSNVTGCMTFVFISDGDLKTDQGWNFELSCFFPCQQVIATGTFDGLTPQQRNAPIKICRDDIVDLAGFGIYPDMNTALELYTQRNSTSQFSWIITPGNPSNTPPPVTTIGYDIPTDSTFALVAFPDSGIYHIKLEIKDSLPDPECKNKNYLDQIVWVSGAPVFDPVSDLAVGTRALQDTICIGDIDTLIGFIQPHDHIDDCVPPTGTLEFIPDGQDTGSGLTYESKAEFKCYPIDATVPGSGLINNASDIVSICMDIEHSAIGDLEMTLTCPSGQSVRFLTQQFGENSNLGQPIDIPGSTAQGTVETYCFDMVAASTMSDVAATLTTVQSLAAGNYLPIDNFSNFIGCEINGNWILTVKDGFNNDNGYVGNWQMTLDPSIQPTFGDNFTNSYSDTSWTEVPANPSSGTIISSIAQSDTLLVQPKAIGEHCYRIEVLDDFGCTYDTTICFIVLDKDTADFEFSKALFCLNEGSQSPTFINNGKAGDFTVSPATGLIVNPTTGSFTPGGSTPGTYTITNTVLNPQGRCPDVHDFVVTIVDTTTPSITANPTYCIEDTARLLNAGSFVSFTWSNSSTNDTTQVSAADNPITLTATDANGCITTSNSVTVTALAQVSSNSTITICEGDSALIHGVFQKVPGLYSQLFSTGATSCDSVSNVTLAFHTKVTAGPDDNICLNQSASLSASGVDLPANFTWDNNFSGASQTVTPVATTTFTVTAVDVHGCVSTDAITVTVSPVRDGSIAYSGATFCPGSPNILPASGFPVTAGGIYSSSPAGFVDPNTGEVFISTAPDGLVFTVNYTLQPFNACDNTNPVTFTITNSFDGAFNYGGSIFCTNGGSVSPIFTGTGAGSFTVSPAFGLSINPSTGVIDLGASAPGNYTITNSPAAGCPGVAGQTVIDIFTPPTVDGGLSQTVCQGISATLSATSPDNVFMVWNIGGAPVANPATDAPSSSTTYTVTAIDAVTGCLATDVTTINVNPLPILSVVASDASICENIQTAVLTASVINSGAFGAPPVYTWSPSTGLDATSGSVVNATPTLASSPITYTVNAFDPITGCASNTSTDDDITITVLPLPVITLTAAPNDTLCLGDNLTLTGAGSAVATVVWTAPPGFSTVINGSPFAVNQVGDFTFSAIAFGTNGCPSAVPVSIDIHVNPLPVINITGTTTQICADGHSEVLTASGGVGYVWSNGALTNPITVTPAVGADVFTVIGTDANGCINNASFDFDVIANNVVADIVADTTLGYPGAVINFTNASANANSFDWDLGDGSPVFTVTDMSGQSATYMDTTFYWAYLTATNTVNGCVNIDSVMILIVPNPAPILHIPNIFTPNGDGNNDTFYIDVTNDMGKSMYVEIYNRWGNPLKVIEDFKDAWTGIDESNGKEASEGVYFFKYKVVGYDDKVYEGQSTVTLIRKQ